MTPKEDTITIVGVILAISISVWFNIECYKFDKKYGWNSRLPEFMRDPIIKREMDLRNRK